MLKYIIDNIFGLDRSKRCHAARLPLTSVSSLQELIACKQTLATASFESREDSLEVFSCDVKKTAYRASRNYRGLGLESTGVQRRRKISVVARRNFSG
jgi:hypothetical protein